MKIARGWTCPVSSEPGQVQRRPGAAASASMRKRGRACDGPPAVATPERRSVLRRPCLRNSTDVWALHVVKACDVSQTTSATRRRLYAGGRPHRLARLLNRAQAALHPAGIWPKRLRDALGSWMPQRAPEIAPLGHRRHRRRAVPSRDARRRRRMGRKRPGGRWTGGAAARAARARSPGGSRAWRAGADPAALSRGGGWRTRTLPRRPAGAAQRVRSDRAAVPGLSRAFRDVTPDHALLLFATASMQRGSARRARRL